MNDSELTMKARGVAGCLTYNDPDDKPQDDAKCLLLEMAHRIDSRDIRADKGRVSNGVGKARNMTWKERFQLIVFGTLPSRV